MRNDIEGLRAFAVLAVLINHAFPKVLPGGFAGVDVFFVISGYLIGRHLLQDIQAGRLSFLSFYAKRARRILPALSLVLISVWGVGWIVLSAPEFSDLGKHMAAATGFANNILLWSESGYFDTGALEKPLLHLWSLGIEEQFYLLVPAILWLGSKGSSPSIRWVARLGALSLTATIVLSNLDDDATFYLLHTRFWELAAGVILAQAELRNRAHGRGLGDFPIASTRKVREIHMFCIVIGFSAVLVLGASDQRWAMDNLIKDGGLTLAIATAVVTAFLADRNVHAAAWNQLRTRWLRHSALLAQASSIIGVFLIGASLLTLSPKDWPGAQTLFPVFGSVFVIAATPHAALNKLLASRPLAAIGGISYPLYLWHWPAIVFWKMLSPDPGGIRMAIPLTVSFILAWLTKMLLEEPMRFGRLGMATFRRPPLWPISLGSLFAGLLGSWVILANGQPSRFPPSLQAIAEWSLEKQDIPWRVGHCYLYHTRTEEFSSVCTPVKRLGVPRILLWGDSHAAHLYPGLVNIQPAQTFDIVQWTAALCPPVTKALRMESATCDKRRAAALSELTQLSPDAILLGGGWGRYLDMGESSDEILSALSETIRRLKIIGIKRIIVFGPGPFWNTSLPTDLFRFMAANRMYEIPERLGKVSDTLWRLDADMAAEAASQKVQYVSILNYFCDKSGCLTVGDRALSRPDLLYFDQDHLTATGSRMLIAHSKLEWLGEN